MFGAEKLLHLIIGGKQLTFSSLPSILLMEKKLAGKNVANIKRILCCFAQFSNRICDPFSGGGVEEKLYDPGRFMVETFANLSIFPLVFFFYVNMYL